MRTEDYAHATAKEIARAAGYSEAALYKHFQDKTEIFLTVLSEQLPGLGTLLTELIEQAGKRTMHANLVDVAATAIEFYTESFPISVSLFSSRSLLTAHRERLAELDPPPDHTGPPSSSPRTCAPSRGSAACDPERTPGPPPRCWPGPACWTGS